MGNVFQCPYHGKPLTTGFVPDNSQRLECFKSITDKKKRVLIKTALAQHGLGMEMTPAELLEVAAKLCGESAESLMADGLLAVCQRRITNAVAGSGNQGSLGAADQRIMDAIDDLRSMVSSGEYRPKSKSGSARVFIPLSNVAGKAMTGMPTIKTFMERHPDWEKKLDVTDMVYTRMPHAAGCR
jgi:hypothetical protein